MTQNLWDTAKAVLREKFIAIEAFLKDPIQLQTIGLNTYELDEEAQSQKLAE